MGASASREKFRESVTALIEVDVSADDAEFWDEPWKLLQLQIEHGSICISRKVPREC